MPFSQAINDALLTWFKGSTFPAAISTVYISLHTASPGVSGTANDVTTSVCGSRGSIAAADLSVPADSALSGGGRQISNTATVTMTASASAGATITYFGLWNAASGGTFLGYGTLSTPRAIQIGDLVQFPIAQLILRGI
jgi:hypothetical protein